MKLKPNSRRSKRGAALVEYALIIGGVTLITVAAVSIFGHKTGSMIGAAGSALPAAQPDDNGPISVGRIADTKKDADGNIVLDPLSGNNTLSDNLGLPQAVIDGLVVDPSH